MKKLLFLLVFIPLVSFGQSDTLSQKEINKLIGNQIKKNREMLLNSNWGDSLMKEKIKKNVSEWDFSEEKIKQGIYNSKNPKKRIYFENIMITSKEDYCHIQERITTELHNNSNNINQVCISIPNRNTC